MALPHRPKTVTPPPLEAYDRLPWIEAIGLSPDGTKLAMIADIKGTRSLLVLNNGKDVLVNNPIGDIKARGIT
ncbi:MAG: hypothetical protein ACKOPO_03095 [Novosphingobium sp.]